MATGRPSKYRDEFAEQAEKLCKLGATDADLADFFKVNTTTIWRWQSKHPAFCNALKVGKDEADEKVERSLYQKATGYTFDSEKIFQHQGEIVRADVREHAPPDTTACIFWLKNRRPDLWRDVKENKTTVTFEDQTKEAADEFARLVSGVAEREGTHKGSDRSQ